MNSQYMNKSIQYNTIHKSSPQGQCTECDCNGNVDPSLGLTCNMHDHWSVLELPE